MSAQPTAAGRSPLSPTATLEAGRLVDEALVRWFRRAAVIFILGVVLFAGFIVAAIIFKDTKNTVNRNGQEVVATIKDVVGTPPKSVTVEYAKDGSTTDQSIELKADAKPHKIGDLVKLSVDRDSRARTIIIGDTKQDRVTSMPVAGLLVSSLLVMGMGLFDMQAARRCRKHLLDKSWRSLRWRGVVYGPGRGRVRAAGFLADPDVDRQYLMVNSLGCWRQGVDLLAEPTELSVAGNPAGIVVVRHPATLRVVLLRPPRGERQRQRALTLLATGAA